jgi:hypothetical protein
VISSFWQNEPNFLSMIQWDARPGASRRPGFVLEFNNFRRPSDHGPQIRTTSVANRAASIWSVRAQSGQVSPVTANDDADGADADAAWKNAAISE